MKIPVTFKLIIILSALLLAACQRDFVLVNQQNMVVGEATLEIDANFPSPARVYLNGKEFSGDWKASKVYEASLAKKYRLLGGAAYEAYKAGNARDQLHQGTANLKANDGSEMACNFKYRSAIESGTCNLNGEVFKLHQKDTKRIDEI